MQSNSDTRETWNSFGIIKIAYDLFIIMCNYVDAYKLMTLQLGGDNNNNNNDAETTAKRNFMKRQQQLQLQQKYDKL